MRAIWTRALARAREEDGVMALATLGFMLSAGMATIVVLWGIGYATGAYNAMYTATQQAAYASVTSTQKTLPGDSSRQQLAFSCVRPTSGNTEACLGGATFAVADQVLSQSLRAGVPGRFGLTYTRTPAGNGSVYLVNENLSPSAMFYAYDVDVASGTARSLCPSLAPGQTTLYIPYGPEQSLLACWRVRELVEFGPQTQSGVVIRTQSRLRVPPGCQLAFCQMTLNVISAATEAQPDPINGYEDYNLYGG